MTDPTDANLVVFGMELKRLLHRARRARGGLKVATLAGRMNTSQSSVYAYFAGTTLPPSDKLDDLLTELGASFADRARFSAIREEIELKGSKPQRDEQRPRQIGAVPLEADCYQPRNLIPSGTGTFVLVGPGGVGKTQLAAARARQVRNAHEVGLILWITATTRNSVVDGYARAAAEVGIEAKNRIEAAELFQAWLRNTLRRWLIVLDDVNDPSVLQQLRPPDDLGTVIITSRRLDSALRKRTHVVVEVPVFRVDESLAYLKNKLADQPEPAAAATSLAEDLGHLPLALAQVSTYMLDRGLGANEYRVRLAQRQRNIADLLPEARALPDDYRLTLDAMWSLTVEQANQMAPADTARPALELASVLSAEGIPVGIWQQPSAIEYLRAGSAVSAALTDSEAHDCVYNLRRFSLMSIDPSTQSAAIHALLQKAVRSSIGADRLPHTVRAAADAVDALWPERWDPHGAATFRANVEALTYHCRVALWDPEIHPVIFKFGNSFGDVGNIGAAITYFEDVVADSTTTHGPESLSTLWARNHMLVWIGKQGDARRACEQLVALAATAAKIFGPAHPLTIELRGNYAFFLGEVGEYAAAITECLKIIDTMDSLETSDPVATLHIRANIAFFKGKSGAAADAAAAYRDLVPIATDVLGPQRVDTLKICLNAAGWRGTAGDIAGSLQEFRTLLPIVRAALGVEHLDTLRTRFHIARLSREVELNADDDELDEVLIATVRLLGPTHPHSIDVRLECALRLRDGGHPDEALEDLKGLCADARDLFGPAHPRTQVIEGEVATATAMATSPAQERLIP